MRAARPIGKYILSGLHPLLGFYRFTGYKCHTGGCLRTHTVDKVTVTESARVNQHAVDFNSGKMAFFSKMFYITLILHGTSRSLAARWPIIYALLIASFNKLLQLCYTFRYKFALCLI